MTVSFGMDFGDDDSKGMSESSTSFFFKKHLINSCLGVRQRSKWVYDIELVLASLSSISPYRHGSGNTMSLNLIYPYF